MIEESDTKKQPSTAKPLGGEISLLLDFFFWPIYLCTIFRATTSSYSQVAYTETL